MRNPHCKFCVPLRPIITRKCGVLVLFITALIITMVFHFPALTLNLTHKMQSELISNLILELPPKQSSRRPKTNLIFNNKDLCASTLLTAERNQRTMVIVVLSSRRHFVKRNMIRQTYGSIRNINNIHILAVVFMLGSLDAPGVEVVDFNKLEAERLQFNDLIMGDFVDSYRNLTIKSIMAYEWLTSYCRGAQFVVKTDDDVILNIFKLTEELNAWSPTETKASNFWCAVHFNEKTVTDVKSRFHVIPNEFPNVTFPNHCAGVGYVTTIGVIGRIINEISSSFLERVCTHEDVFMTAIVVNKINSILTQSGSQNETIKLVDRSWDWVSLDLETLNSNEAEFLLKLFQQSNIDESEIDEFRRKFGTKIFYLLTHNLEFEGRYHRLWQIIKQTFHKG